MSQEIPLGCVALTTVRRRSGKSKQEVADRLRIPWKTMAMYETALVPPPDLLAAILEVLGRESAEYEEVLSVLERSRRREAVPPATPVEPTPEEWAEIDARAIVAGREAELRSVAGLADAVRAHKTAAARAGAEPLCARLEMHPKPWLVVEKVREVQTWAVAERLAHRSVDAAPDCADQAMELSALAYRAADLAPCEGPFRDRLLGYTLFIGGNALRAAGEIAEAGALSGSAEEHWEAGAAAPGPLQEWRLQSLAGSLHRDQQRLAESLARHDVSLAKAPPEARARLLVAKALTVERMGETRQAIQLLIEAERTVDRQEDPRLFFIILFNRVSFLGRLGQFGEAKILLAEIEAAAESLGRGLHQTRLRWLRGSVAAGLGRWEEAETCFQTARRELAHRNADLEAALVSLELVVLLCRRERSREIGKLAHWLARLACSRKLSRDARAALRLVCDAARGEGVTLALAEQALLLLQQAPKADAVPPGRTGEQPGGACAGPSGVLADGGSHGAAATAVGVDDAAAVQGLGAARSPQEMAGRRPDGDQPGGHLVHEAGGLHGGGPAGRQGRGRRREQGKNDKAGGKMPPSDYASKHESSSFRGRSQRALSWTRYTSRPENTRCVRRFMTIPEIHPADFVVLVRVFLAFRNWTQQELADAAGLSVSTISSYLKGMLTRPTRGHVEQLARAVQMELFLVDLYLLPAIAAWREHPRQADAVTAIVEQLQTEMQGLVHHLLPLLQGIGAGGSPVRPPAEEALDLWSRLEDCDAAERWSLVEEWREYQRPGLVELLCYLSEDAASDRADRALELAQLALRVAELVPGEGAEKTGLLGSAGIFLANAVRVAGELKTARGRFEEGLAHWKAGAESPAFLPEWRVLDFEASLLRDERQFETALVRLAEALNVAPAELTGRIRLSTSAVYEQMGEGERAVEELRKAEHLVDREREPRLFFGVHFNLATALCMLDQFEEAEAMYPQIQELADGRELDTVRLKWLAGRIGAGRGRLDEAGAALDEVRQEFERRRAPWDCSLVTLELATVRLLQERTADVRTLAEELMWVFEAQGIHREALAALTLFEQAAKRETATADFTDRLVRYLRKAQGDPELRFLV